MRWWNYFTPSLPWWREPKTFSVWSKLYRSFVFLVSVTNLCHSWCEAFVCKHNTTGHILQCEIFVTHGALKAMRVLLGLPRAEHILSNCKVAVQVQWNSYHHVTENSATAQVQCIFAKPTWAEEWKKSNSLKCWKRNAKQKAFTVQMPIQKWQSALAACALARQTRQS